MNTRFVVPMFACLDAEDAADAKLFVYELLRDVNRRMPRSYARLVVDQEGPVMPLLPGAADPHTLYPRTAP